MKFNKKVLKNIKHKFLASVMAAVMVIPAACPLFVFGEENQTAPKDGEEAVGVVTEVANYLSSYSRYDDVSTNGLFRQGLLKILENNPELYGDVMRAMLESIDEHSEYYSPEEAEGFISNISGTVVGIGITFDMKPEGVNVVSVIRDTPAYNAGIQVGDIIVSAGGTELAGMGSEQAASYIKGEENSSVTVGVKRDGVDNIMYFDMVREKIVGTSVESKIYQSDDGKNKAMYIRVYGFVSNTAECFKGELEKAKKEGIYNIIIDLRDNGGGIFDQAIEMADYLVPKGSIITTEDHKISVFNQVYKSETEKNWGKDNSERFNTIVLINENSASASEVLTAALKENESAYVIGQKSYGKGTIQTVVNLPYGDCAKFTIAYYLTPQGNNLNKVGITPDSSVENSYERFDISKYKKFSYMNIYDIGIESKDEEVKTAKRLLKVWGSYNGEINDIYDKDMYDAVYRFQMSTGLYPYGVLDMTTQHELYTRLELSRVLKDEQLDAALSRFNITRKTSDTDK